MAASIRFETEAFVTDSEFAMPMTRCESGEVQVLGQCRLNTGDQRDSMNAHSGALFRPEAVSARGERLHGEVVLTQPVRFHVLVTLLAAIAVAACLWLSFGQYTRTETARGILVTSNASTPIRAVRAGQILELAVREGDLVQKGQRLAVVQVEQASETSSSAIGDSIEAIGAQKGLAEQQIRLAGIQAQADQERIAATLSVLRQQRAGLAHQIALQGEMVRSMRDTHEQIGPVVEKGFVSRTEAERRRQAVLAAQQELSRLQQQQAVLAGDEVRARGELARLGSQTLAEVAQVRSSVATLAQQRARLQAERSYVLTAPAAGRVTALQTAVGRTVDGEIPLMVIVPEDYELRADIFAPSRAIGFIAPDQEVRLLLDAFPYQRFGSSEGRIETVSRVVIDPRELDAPLQIDEPVYRVRAKLSRQNIDAFGERQPLQPGMTLTANIILERRSFLDWLLQPLYAVLRRSG